jgi:hypothetical protein
MPNRMQDNMNKLAVLALAAITETAAEFSDHRSDLIAMIGVAMIGSVGARN